MIETEKKQFLTKADLRLVSGILLAALILFLFLGLNRAEGAYARISYDGMAVLQIPLSQPDEKYYLFTGRAQPWHGETPSDGEEPSFRIRELSQEELEAVLHSEAVNGADDYNLILCRDGEVQMVQSSCPDQICVRHSAVSATGEAIICLPHKIVVEVIGEEEQPLDGVAY